MTPVEAGQQVNDVMSALPMKWLWKSTILTGLGFSDGIIWSRAARRKAAKRVEAGTDETEYSFGIKIVIGTTEDNHGSKVTIRWVKGHDSVAFESFSGMLVKKLSEK